jgi:predicted metal-binding membrane protein
MIEAVLRRDRTIILVGLVGITALAWAYMFHLAWQMGQMSMEMAMPQVQAWTGAEFLLTCIMWAVMMVAMMTPSAAPMVLSFAKISRSNGATERPLLATLLFLMAYVLIWTAFSLGAAAIQWLLHTTALMSPMMVATNTLVGAGLLVTAGLFQFSGVKHRCLHHCRTPFSFFLTEWKPGVSGAFRMGAKHGLYCLGCCWILMLLLFVAGVMNLLWVAALAGLVLLEKILPAGAMVSRLAGVVFIVWAAVLWAL